jgi:hypothetical protein
MKPSVITTEHFRKAENKNRPPTRANFRVAHVQEG